MVQELIKEGRDIGQNEWDILQRYDDDIAAILPSAQRVLGLAHDMIDGSDQYSVSLFIIY